MEIRIQILAGDSRPDSRGEPSSLMAYGVRPISEGRTSLDEAESSRVASKRFRLHLGSARRVLDRLIELSSSGQWGNVARNAIISAERMASESPPAQVSASDRSAIQAACARLREGRDI